MQGILEFDGGGEKKVIMHVGEVCKLNKKVLEKKMLPLYA